MKENEAPEKIYVVDATFPDYVDFDGSPINTKRIDDHDIEYIRKDVLIEKAKEFIWSHTEGSDYHVNYVLKEFENYMKGE